MRTALRVSGRSLAISAGWAFSILRHGSSRVFRNLRFSSASSALDLIFSCRS
jgi:hypothetical protein